MENSLAKSETKSSVNQETGTVEALISENDETEEEKEEESHEDDGKENRTGWLRNVICSLLIIVAFYFGLYLVISHVDAAQRKSVTGKYNS